MNALLPVLLVEDDPIISKTLRMSLRYHSFELTAVATLREAMEELAKRSFALIMLDVCLPDGSGIDLCRTLRARDENIAVLMLTARTDEQTAIDGIQGGADDFVRKPYSLGELAARMHRLVKRSTRAERDILTCGVLAIDLQRRIAHVADAELQLGKKEFDILALLVRAEGSVVTRDQILRALGVDDKIYDRTVDSHLSHVRSKLKSAGAALRIVAIYGVGYRLEVA